VAAHYDPFLFKKSSFLTSSSSHKKREQTDSVSFPPTLFSYSLSFPEMKNQLGARQNPSEVKAPHHKRIVRIFSGGLSEV